MEKQEAKKLLSDNFEQLKSMSVQEVLLYKKGVQLNSEKMTKGIENNREKIGEVKSNIGTPDDPYDFYNLNIKVIPVGNDNDLEIKGNVLRHLTSSSSWYGSPGRLLKFIVVHEEEGSTDPFFGMTQPKGKYLGCISLSSDFIQIGGRDEVIGWSREQRLNGMLNHTSMGSSIVPTQPIGYSYVGGKLIALLTTSDVIENRGNEKYKNTLAGVTTTSLFGGFSQYNNLKYWKKCGSSDGQIQLEPSDEIYKQVRKWAKQDYENDIRDVEKGSGKKIAASRPKGKVLNFIYKKLGVTPPVANAPRGVYWCDLFTNTRRFLREEDTKLGEKRFDNSVETLSQLWKDKYASKRIEKLLEKDKFTTDMLFYDRICGMEGEEVRKEYLNDIGR